MVRVAPWVLGFLVAALTLAAAPASATTNADVVSLAGNCPPVYLAVEQSDDYSAEQQANALAGDFDLLGSPFHIEAPANWNADPFRSQRWRSLYHSFKWIDQLLFVEQGGGIHTPEERRAALERARDLAVDWVRQNPLGGKGVDDRAWQDKVVGDRVPYLSYITVASACAGILSDAQANDLLSGLEVHRGFLSDPRIYKGSNHGLFVDYGLALLARYLPGKPAADASRNLARMRFEETLRARADVQRGVWLEHSPAYQQEIIELLDGFRRALNSRDIELERFSNRLKDVLALETEPDGFLVPFGDTNFEHVPSAAIAARAADDPPLVVLSKAGYAFARAGRSYLAIAASYFNRTHKHWDELTFDLFEGGERVVTDTGFYELDPGRARTFQESPQAHSTLTVDHKEFKPSGGAYRSGILAGGRGRGWVAVLGENPLLEGDGVEHRRLFLYKPGVALIVVDRAQSEKAHTFQRQVQIGPTITTTPAGNKSIALTSSGGYRATISDESRPGSKLSVVRGRSDPLGGFSFPGFRRLVPRDTLIWDSGRGKSLDAVTTIASGPGPGVTARAERANGKDFKRNRYEVDISGPGMVDSLKVGQDGDELDVR